MPVQVTPFQGTRLAEAVIRNRAQANQDRQFNLQEDRLGQQQEQFNARQRQLTDAQKNQARQQLPVVINGLLKGIESVPEGQRKAEYERRVAAALPALQAGVELEAFPAELVNQLTNVPEEALKGNPAQRFDQFFQTESGGLVGASKASGTTASIDLPEGTRLRQPGTQVNINDKTETEFDKLSGRGIAEIKNSIREASVDARTQRINIDAAEGLLESGLSTGQLAPAITRIRSFADALGIETEGLGQAQLFEALGTQFATAIIQQTKGAVSDAEMNLFLAASPGLAQSVEGNRLMLLLMRKMNDQVINLNRRLVGKNAKEVEQILAEAENEEIFTEEEREMLRGAGGEQQQQDFSLDELLREQERRGRSTQ